MSTGCKLVCVAVLCVLVNSGAACLPTGPAPSATLDAGPIATSSGSGNQPPVADAGADQLVVDAEDGGDELVELDGSGSHDPDGTIASHVWSEAGVQVATGMTAGVILTVGRHIITLVVTDDEGSSGTDTLVIDVAGLPTLTPTAAPTRGPTPTPGRTPRPTAGPGNGPTPTPRFGPTPTTDPAATATPDLAGTATAAPTEEPTPTVAPTATPTVEPTATPTPTPSGEQACDDDADSDHDGATDCADTDCENTPVCLGEGIN